MAKIYSDEGRHSILPEQLLSTLLLQALDLKDFRHPLRYAEHSGGAIKVVVEAWTKAPSRCGGGGRIFLHFIVDDFVKGREQSVPN